MGCNKTSKSNGKATQFFLFILLFAMMIPLSEGYRLNSNYINNLTVNTLQTVTNPPTQLGNIGNLTDGVVTTEKVFQTISNASINQTIIINLSSLQGSINNFSFAYDSVTCSEGANYPLKYLNVYLGNELFSFDIPFNATNNLYAQGNYFIEGDDLAVTNKYDYIVLETGFDATCDGSIGNPNAWNSHIYDIIFDVNAEINNYPNITSFNCVLLNRTSMEYRCQANATDIENDTIYYAIDCAENQKSFQYILRADITGENSSLYNFDSENQTYLGYVGGLFYNVGQGCNYPSNYSFVTGKNGIQFNNQLCSNPYSDVEQSRSMNLYLYKPFSNSPITDKYFINAEVYSENNSEMTLDFKESLVNPLSSQLVYNITNRNGQYIISYSTTNYTSGFSTPVNFSAETISVETYLDYFEHKFTLQVRDENDVLKYSLANIPLGDGIPSSFVNNVLKLYNKANNTNAYITKLEAYTKNLPSFYQQNNRTCHYNSEQNVSAIVYVSDSAHGFDDYSNYLEYSFLVKPYLSIFASSDATLQEWKEPTQLAFLWALFGVCIVILILGYRMRGELSVGMVAGVLFFFVLMSLPLLYFDLIPAWTVIIDALIVAGGVIAFLNNASGGSR